MKRFLVFTLLAMASIEANAEVFLFTDRMHPFTDTAGHPVIYLDAVADIEEDISQGLDDLVTSEDMTPEQLLEVRSFVQQRMAGHNIMDAYAGLSLAWSLGVTHLPAVVENGRAVYGMTDAVEALELIRDSGE